MVREIRSLEILSVKKEAKLSASEVTEVEEGKGDEDLRCSNLYLQFARDGVDFQTRRKLSVSSIVRVRTRISISSMSASNLLLFGQNISEVSPHSALSTFRLLKLGVVRSRDLILL